MLRPLRLPFPECVAEGSRFKVGVQGSRRRREVVAFVFASVRNRPQSFARVRKRSQAFAERRTCVGLAGETKIVAKRSLLPGLIRSY